MPRALRLARMSFVLAAFAAAFTIGAALWLVAAGAYEMEQVLERLAQSEED